MTSLIRPESVLTQENEAVWRLIEEVVPELKASDKKSVVLPGYNDAILQLSEFVFGLFVMSVIFFAAFFVVWFVTFLPALLIFDLGLLASWGIGIYFRMKRMRKEALLQEERVSEPRLPTLNEIQRRFLERMQRTLEESKNRVVGKTSEVSMRLAELDAKIEQAKTLAGKVAQYKDEDPEMRVVFEKALETVRLFEEDRNALASERERVQVQIRDLEMLIPRESTRFEKSQLIAQVYALSGEAKASRPVSRKLVEDTIRPLAERYVTLNTARETLITHALAASNFEPGALSRFLKEADRSGQNIAVIERKGLKLVGNGE